jgi:hypothetical protein
MASTDEEAALYKIVKAASKQAVKQGSAKAGLPDYVARFLAGQLAFTMDLLRKGASVTPGTLKILFLRKFIGMADLATEGRYDCAASVALLGISLTNSFFLTTVSGPLGLLAEAADLLSQVYAADRSCGLSDAAYRQIEKVATPAAMWLEQGVVDWLTHPQ